MFGSVLVRFQAYISERLGKERWEEILSGASLPPDKIYRTARFYPDEELDSLLDSASKRLNLTKDVLYRQLGLDFGRYLIKTYRVMFFPSWRTMEVIEKAAPKVYKSIQFVDLNAPKSSVNCVRLSPTEVVVHYQSPRKMCPYILGIIDSMAEYFDEKIEVSHAHCMLSGADECEIHVKLIKAQKESPAGKKIAS
jgi:predicted hydrocarbon binding protein